MVEFSTVKVPLPNHKYISLRGSTILVRPKPDVSFYIVISDSEKAGSGQGDVNFLLVPLNGRDPLRFERLQAGT